MKNMPDINVALELLTSRVDALIQHCDDLRRENGQLRSAQEKLALEKASLQEKNIDARTRIDLIIEKLKSNGSGT